MNASLETLLISCIDELDAGVPVEQIVDRYPDEAVLLRPILLLTAQLSTVADDPPLTAQHNSADMFLTRAAVLKKADRPRQTRWTWRLGMALGIVAMLLLASFGVVSVSAEALPGDPLYSVKRTSEQWRLRLANDPDSMRSQLGAERADEVRRLLKIGREEEAEYVGVIESIDGEAWLIGGVPVIVETSTRIEGTPVVGSWVEMEGATRNGVLVATEIEVKGGGQVLPQQVLPEQGLPQQPEDVNVPPAIIDDGDDADESGSGHVNDDDVPVATDSADNDDDSADDEDQDDAMDDDESADDSADDQDDDSDNGGHEPEDASSDADQDNSAEDDNSRTGSADDSQSDDGRSDDDEADDDQSDDDEDEGDSADNDDEDDEDDEDNSGSGSSDHDEDDDE